MKNVIRALALVAFATLAVHAEDAPKAEHKMECCKKADKDACMKEKGCTKDCCQHHHGESEKK